MSLGFPAMPDHPALETKCFLYWVFLSVKWRFHLCCSATARCLSSAAAGLWPCAGVTALGAPGAHGKSFLGASSEKPCSWAALTVAVFIVLCRSCGLPCFFFRWPLHSEHASCTARFEACSCSESRDAEWVMCVTWLGAMVTGRDTINAQWWIHFRDTPERTAALCYRKSLLQNFSPLPAKKTEKMTDKISAQCSLPCLFGWADPSSSHLQLQCGNINMDL